MKAFCEQWPRIVFVLDVMQGAMTASAANLPVRPRPRHRRSPDAHLCARFLRATNRRATVTFTDSVRSRPSPTHLTVFKRHPGPQGTGHRAAVYALYLLCVVCGVVIFNLDLGLALAKCAKSVRVKRDAGAEMRI
jgi:hypothetical protein